MKVFEVKEKCKKCDGTGVYVGMGERDGSSVVCYQCKGSGCNSFRYEYEEFTERKKRKGIKMVLEYNPGIMVGNGDNCKLEDFGGINYKDWLKDEKFPKGTEMRKYSCPAMWYQSVNGKLKPNWDECINLGSFSSCEQHDCKSKCWEKFDKENNN